MITILPTMTTLVVSILPVKIIRTASWFYEFIFIKIYYIS